jgi:hypothetical protein
MQALLLVAELDGPAMFARIGVMKGLEPSCRAGVQFVRKTGGGFRVSIAQGTVPL